MLRLAPDRRHGAPATTAAQEKPLDSRTDSYRSFAGHYDLHQLDWYARAYGRRLQDLLNEKGLSGGRILDAGCGTGTLALTLAGEGFRVTGVDLSDELLAVARSKDPSGSVSWRQADITRLDLGEMFDGVVSVADVLNHLETIDDWEQAFRRFAAHLRPGGYLFFDVLTCSGLEQLDTFAVDEKEGMTLILGIIWEAAARRSTMKVTSFRPVTGERLYERAKETITEWGQPVAAIYERLARAGFEPVERPWPTSDDPEKDERLNVIARRT